MDEIIDKFNTLSVHKNEKSLNEELNYIDNLIENIKKKPIDSNEELKKLTKNYKKINDMESILNAFKSCPEWKDSIERSFKNIISLIDQTNKTYIEEINFNIINNNSNTTIPPLTDFWDKQSAQETLIHIKELLVYSIQNTNIKEKIKQICDAYTLILILLEPVFNTDNMINIKDKKRVKKKSPKPLGIKNNKITKL